MARDLGTEWQGTSPNACIGLPWTSHAPQNVKPKNKDIYIFTYLWYLEGPGARCAVGQVW